MGRNVYLFALKGIDSQCADIAKNLIALGYIQVKDEKEWGIYLEKALPYGIIEAHINYDFSFIRIAKPNSEETIDILLSDIIKLKKKFPELILYDMEAKQNVDLGDGLSLKKLFLIEKEKFLLYFPSFSKFPVRGDDIFRK